MNTGSAERVRRLAALTICAIMFLPVCHGCVDTTIYEYTPPPEPAYWDSVYLNDLDYVRDQYFFLMDTLSLYWSGELQFSQVTVYLDDGNGTNNEGGISGYALGDALSLPEEESWDTLAYHGYFDTLALNEDYVVDLSTGELNLVHPLLAPYHLAATYLYGEQAVGGLDDESRLILQMIRPSDMYVIERGQIWKSTASRMMRRNIYSLGAENIDEEVNISIFRREPDVDRETQGEYLYSMILGVDLRDEDGVLASPENDWATDSLVDPSRINRDLGLLLFPDLWPFAPRISPGGRPESLELTVPRIYEEHPAYLKVYEDSKYYIIVRFNPIHGSAGSP